MSTEERLVRALQGEADEVQVDVHRMHAEVRSRTGTPVRRRWWRSAAPVLVAAVVLAVLAGVALLRLDGLGLDTGPTTDAPQRGGVDTRFTCPAQITANEAQRQQDDDALVLDLDSGPAQAARTVGAPRYAYRETGDRALLRLGNADGTLAATASFHRSGDRWVLDTTQRCSGRDNGISVPGTNDLRLGRRDTAPYPAKAFALNPDTAVLVDDRSTYDQSGFARHRSTWAAPCEHRRICVVGGIPTSHVIAEIRPGRAPEDITSVLLDPDAMVGRRAPLALWGVYDADGSVTAVTAERQDGSARPAEAVSGPRWTGRLLLLLDDPKEVRRVTVTHSDGATDHYRPDQLLQ
jgi:hypothetical protein